MKSKKSLVKMNLRLFDGEGTGAAPEGTPAAAEENGSASLGKKSKTGEKTVLYGKQEEPAAPAQGVETKNQVAADTKQIDPAARRAEFERLIKGDYKDLFTETTQGIIDKRFRETKTMEKQLGEAQPVLEALMTKYGVTDVNALASAIDADERYWEDVADKEGLTVEQYKEKQKILADNARLKKITENAAAQQKTQQIYNGWLQEAETIKANDYPDFDLRQELSDQRFVDLISSGHVDLKTAYEVLHIGSIKTNVAQKAEANVASTIRANGQRPSENGTSSQSGVVIKSDPSALTKQDRAEVARRVARGEKISF